MITPAFERPLGDGVRLVVRTVSGATFVGIEQGPLLVAVPIETAELLALELEQILKAARGIAQ